jgi:YD repeat-containing protein
MIERELGIHAFMIVLVSFHRGVLPMTLIKSALRMVVVLAAVLVALPTRGDQPQHQAEVSDKPLETIVATGPGTLRLPRVFSARAAPQPLSSARKAPQVPPMAMLATPRSDGTKVEPVTERHPNGNVKVERQVIRDAAGNYVNHGTYIVYDLDGKILKRGVFQNGKQHGTWTQTLATNGEYLALGQQQKEFSGPFVSEATFIDGKLDGTWTITDREGQKIIEWSFDRGVRDGRWTWWHSNGQKWLEATYKKGVLDGELLEWDRDGEVTAQSTYIGGRYLAKTVEWYALGQKKFEGAYLQVPGVPQPVYDWWTGGATAPSALPTGEDQKHGPWIGWYGNGNKKTEGRYDHDVPVSKFTWWYENGQKQAEGGYEAGLKSGTWTTWHPNGLRESQVTYVDGERIGTWMRWDAQGKLVGMRDFNIKGSKNTLGNRGNTSRRPSSAATRTR